MDIRVLRYFLAAAQEENITKAAEMLHTTQSNLSRQLADLESELGKTLFIRGKRKITLTEEGMFLRKRAQEIVELSDRTENDVRMMGNTVSGTIHIGAVETHAMHLIGCSILSLKKDYPDIQYDFFSGSIAELGEMLDKGLIDFALMVAPIDMEKYMYLKVPVTDYAGLLMRSDCPLAEKKVIHPEDIGSYPVFVAHQQAESNSLNSWLGKYAGTLNVIAGFNLITNPSMLIDEGFGMAFTFANLVNTEGTNLIFRPLEPRMESDLYLVWKKFDMFTRASNLFLEELKRDWEGMHK